MLVSNLTSNEFVQIKISLKHTILHTNAFTFQLRLRLQDVKIKRDEKMKYSLITLSVFFAFFDDWFSKNYMSYEMNNQVYTLKYSRKIK